MQHWWLKVFCPGVADLGFQSHNNVPPSHSSQFIGELLEKVKIQARRPGELLHLLAEAPEEPEIDVAGK